MVPIVVAAEGPVGVQFTKMVRVPYQGVIAGSVQ
jgi:hypothetical protein